MGRGVSDLHVDGILDVAARNNFFLFVRPTEDDSIRLINEGYATKSMDIHDKSSNWGPMAGFVPCDGAFSKLPLVPPRKDFHPHPHGLAQPTQLKLTRGVIQAQVGANKMEKDLQRTIMRTDFVQEGKSMSGMLVERRLQLTNAYDVYHASSPLASWTRRIAYAIDPESLAVWWFEMDPGAAAHPTQAVVLHPMMVWGYFVDKSLKPVTGDYDIWALVPHISALPSIGDHAMVRVDRGAHGDSAASNYLKRISTELNVACRRATNPVFNHGAEAQNFGFTQKHDTDILMLPPVRDRNLATRIPIGQLKTVLAEIERAGYLVLLNRQWTVPRPKLMGRELPELYEWFRTIETALKDNALERARKLSPASKSAPKVRPLPPANPELATKNDGATAPPKYWKAYWKIVAHREITTARKLKSQAFDKSRNEIVDWYKGLLALMERLDNELTVLTLSHFPPGYHKAQREKQQLQLAIERKATQAMSGGGENYSEALEKEIEERGAELLAYWKGTLTLTT